MPDMSAESLPGEAHWPLLLAFEAKPAGALAVLAPFDQARIAAVETCAVDEERIDLGSVVQRGGKTVYAWAFNGNWPEGAVFHSNTFSLEWPPRSGRFRDVPEVDRGEFFTLPVARKKIDPAQAAFIDRLLDHLAPEK